MPFSEGWEIDLLTMNKGSAKQAATSQRTTVVTNAFLAVKRMRLERQTEI